MHPIEQECQSCGQTFPLDCANWRKNASSPTGYVSAASDCNTCWKTKQGLKDLARRERSVELGRRDVQLKALKGQMVGGAPHTAELVEKLYNKFGGVDGFVDQLYIDFCAMEPGKLARIQIMQTIISLTVANTKVGGAKKPLDLLTIEELEDEVNARVLKVSQKLMARLEGPTVDDEEEDTEG